MFPSLQKSNNNYLTIDEETTMDQSGCSNRKRKKGQGGGGGGGLGGASTSRIMAQRVFSIDTGARGEAEQEVLGGSVSLPQTPTKIFKEIEQLHKINPRMHRGLLGPGAGMDVEEPEKALGRGRRKQAFRLGGVGPPQSFAGQQKTSAGGGKSTFGGNMTMTVSSGGGVLNTSSVLNCSSDSEGSGKGQRQKATTQARAEATRKAYATAMQAIAREQILSEEVLALHLPGMDKTDRPSQFVSDRMNFLRTNPDALTNFNITCSGLQNDKARRQREVFLERERHIQERLQEKEERRKRRILRQLKRAEVYHRQRQGSQLTVAGSNASHECSSRKASQVPIIPLWALEPQGQHPQSNEDDDHPMKSSARQEGADAGGGSKGVQFKLIVEEPRGNEMLRFAVSGSDVSEDSSSEYEDDIMFSSHQQKRKTDKKSPGQQEVFAHTATGHEVHQPAKPLTSRSGVNRTRGQDGASTARPLGNQENLTTQSYKQLSTTGALRRTLVADQEGNKMARVYASAMEADYYFLTDEYQSRLMHLKEDQAKAREHYHLVQTKVEQAAETKQYLIDLIKKQKEWLKLIVLARGMKRMQKFASSDLVRQHQKLVLCFAALIAGRWRWRVRRRKQIMARRVIRQRLPALLQKIRVRKYTGAMDTIKPFLRDVKFVMYFPRRIKRFFDGVRDAQMLIRMHLRARQLWKAALLAAWEDQVRTDIQDYLILTAPTSVISADKSGYKKRRLEQLKDELLQSKGGKMPLPLVMFIPVEVRIAMINYFTEKWTHESIRILIKEDEERQKNPDWNNKLKRPTFQDSGGGSAEQQNGLVPPEKKAGEGRNDEQQTLVVLPAGETTSNTSIAAIKENSNASVNNKAAAGASTPLTPHHPAVSNNSLQTPTSTMSPQQLPPPAGGHGKARTSQDVLRVLEQRRKKSTENGGGSFGGSSTSVVLSAAAPSVPNYERRSITPKVHERMQQITKDIEAKARNPKFFFKDASQHAKDNIVVAGVCSIFQRKRRGTTVATRSQPCAFKMFLGKDEIRRLVREVQQGILEHQKQCRDVREMEFMSSDGKSLEDVAAGIQKQKAVAVKRKKKQMNDEVQKQISGLGDLTQSAYDVPMDDSEEGEEDAINLSGVSPSTGRQKSFRKSFRKNASPEESGKVLVRKETVGMSLLRKETLGGKSRGNIKGVGMTPKMQQIEEILATAVPTSLLQGVEANMYCSLLTREIAVSIICGVFERNSNAMKLNFEGKLLPSKICPTCATVKGSQIAAFLTQVAKFASDSVYNMQTPYDIADNETFIFLREERDATRIKEQEAKKLSSSSFRGSKKISSIVQRGSGTDEVSSPVSGVGGPRSSGGLLFKGNQSEFVAPEPFLQFPVHEGEIVNFLSGFVKKEVRRAAKQSLLHHLH